MCCFVFSQAGMKYYIKLNRFIKWKSRCISTMKLSKLVIVRSEELCLYHKSLKENTFQLL